MFVACETSIGKVGLPLQVIFSVTYDLFMAGTLKLGHQVSGIGCATVRGRQVLPKPNMSLGWELGTLPPYVSGLTFQFCFSPLSALLLSLGSWDT